MKQYLTLSQILFLYPWNRQSLRSLCSSGCVFIWELILNLGQKSLHSGCKGRDRLFLSLVYMVEVPHKQIKGLYITTYNGKFLILVSNGTSGPRFVTVSAAAPLREHCMHSLNAESLYVFLRAWSS